MFLPTYVIHSLLLADTARCDRLQVIICQITDRRRGHVQMVAMCFYGYVGAMARFLTCPFLQQTRLPQPPWGDKTNFHLSARLVLFIWSFYCMYLHSTATQLLHALHLSPVVFQL